MTTSQKSPAPKRPRGRPPVADRRENLTIRVTTAERERFDQAGGPEWFRAALKRARIPEPGEAPTPAASAAPARDPRVIGGGA